MIFKTLGNLQSEMKQVSSSFLFLIFKFNSLTSGVGMDVSSVMATLRSKTVVCPGVYSQGKVVLPHLQLRIEAVVLVSPVVVAVVADAEVVVAMVAEVVAEAEVAVVVVLEEGSGAATKEAIG